MRAVLKVGSKEYVIMSEDMNTILDILDGGEVFERLYHGGPSNVYTYHVYPQTTDVLEVRYITESLYAMAKAAGKPEND